MDLETQFEKMRVGRMIAEERLEKQSTEIGTLKKQINKLQQDLTHAGTTLLESSEGKRQNVEKVCSFSLAFPLCINVFDFLAGVVW